MEIEFDPAKDTLNRVKHGLPLSRAVELQVLHVETDARFDYSEVRYRAFGLLDGLPHCLAFTRRGAVFRVLSLRRMHLKEFRRYVP